MRHDSCPLVSIMAIDCKAHTRHCGVHVFRRSRGEVFGASTTAVILDLLEDILHG